MAGAAKEPNGAAPAALLHAGRALVEYRDDDSCRGRYGRGIARFTSIACCRSFCALPSRCSRRRRHLRSGLSRANAAIAAAFTLLIPMQTWIGAVVNNDVLVIPLGGIATVGAARLPERARSALGLRRCCRGRGRDTDEVDGRAVVAVGRGRRGIGAFQRRRREPNAPPRLCARSPPHSRFSRPAPGGTF